LPFFYFNIVLRYEYKTFFINLNYPLMKTIVYIDPRTGCVTTFNPRDKHNK